MEQDGTLWNDTKALDKHIVSFLAPKINGTHVSVGVFFIPIFKRNSNFQQENEKLSQKTSQNFSF